MEETFLHGCDLLVLLFVVGQRFYPIEKKEVESLLGMFHGLMVMAIDIYMKKPYIYV